MISMRRLPRAHGRITSVDLLELTTDWMNRVLVFIDLSSERFLFCRIKSGG